MKTGIDDISLSLDGNVWRFSTQTVKNLTQHTIKRNGVEYASIITSQNFRLWALEEIEYLVKMETTR